MAKTYTLGEAKRILRMREKQQEEFINERLTLEAREKILDSLTADQLRSIGKRFERRAKKDLKRSAAAFFLADRKDKQGGAG